MQIGDLNLTNTHLLIDHDTRYTDSLDTVFETEATEVKWVGRRTPNMNAYADRWVQTLGSECLDSSWQAEP